MKLHIDILTREKEFLDFEIPASIKTDKQQNNEIQDDLVHLPPVPSIMKIFMSHIEIDNTSESSAVS